MGSYVWVLGLYFITGFDFAPYSAKDWLQVVAAVLGITGSTYGAWKAFRYSKGQIAKRLLEYLEEHEKNVDEVRHLVVPYLRNGRAIERKPDLEMHKRVENAIKLAGRGQEQEAEKDLEGFVVILTRSAEVGRLHMDIAKRQAATILVCTGLLAQSRGDITTARGAWTRALDENPGDAEAIRCLGELELAAGHGEEALEHFTKAVTLAPNDNLLRAETASMRAEYYKKRGNPRLELNALHDSAPHFEEVGEHRRAADAHARAAEIEDQLGQVIRAPGTLKKAYHSYFRAHDRPGADRVRQRLSDMGEDVSGLPAFDEPSRWPSIPWQWVRLLLEVLILLAACYVAIMR
jgi:tetratricopeptide (TPR) repeat protein